MYKKVLIVDDDASFAFSLMNKAVDYDCGISLAESIGRAKVMLKNNHYDVILANSRVPGGFSYTLKNEIDSDTQILFMSSMKSDCDELNKMGVDCIRKNEICRKIEAICG
jgi:DNA-binding NtrC family response regulator